MSDEVTRTRAADHDGRTRPTRDAATVLLLRDGDSGLEVLMQERHLETDFVGGALVFPGGAVDPDDGDLPPGRWRGADLARVGAALGADEAGALALLVAAARETFEEAGLLLAVDADGSTVGADLLARPDVAAVRAELAARDDGGDLAALLEAHDLVLDLGALEPFAWWVTPEGMHRRYDTRFFVTAVPAEQADAASGDAVETMSARWLQPAQVLEDGRAGRWTVIFPTRRVLEQLAAFDDVAAVLDAARGDRLGIERIQPEVVRVDGRVLVQTGDGRPPEEP